VAAAAVLIITLPKLESLVFIARSPLIIISLLLEFHEPACVTWSSQVAPNALDDGQVCKIFFNRIGVTGCARGGHLNTTDERVFRGTVRFWKRVCSTFLTAIINSGYPQ
jgi:hypothetical protein